MRDAGRRTIALGAVLLLLAACTGTKPELRPTDPRAHGATGAERSGNVEGEGETAFAREVADQLEQTQERIDALEEALREGSVGITGDLASAPAAGWAGEEIVNRRGNDWEPAVAADPNSPYVYVLHNRYGGKAACGHCPDPAMILHVSSDGGQTWQHERYLCTCRGVRGQFDPMIEVVPETGDVIAVWMNGFHIRFSRSTDHGATWSPDVSVQGHVNWGDKPNLAVSPDGQDVYVQFNGPTGGDIWAAVSHDGGQSWQQERVTRSDRYFYDYGGEVLPDGRVVFSQISFTYTGPDDSVQGVQQIHLVSTDDGGSTWSVSTVDELHIGSPCTSRACYPDFYDSGPALAQDADGDLVMVYNGSSRNEGTQSIYARSSTDGGRTWSERVRVSEPRVNSAFPAAVGYANDDIRVWFADERTGRWNTWYTRSTDLGATWSEPVRISDARSGTAYKNGKGYLEVYGDYGEIDVTNEGKTIAAWGEGTSYYGPGGVWFNRER
jgi:hypothetical protein